VLAQCAQEPHNAPRYERKGSWSFTCSGPLANPESGLPAIQILAHSLPMYYSFGAAAGVSSVWTVFIHSAAMLFRSSIVMPA
jgi:hypothetical protein